MKLKLTGNQNLEATLIKPPKQFKGSLPALIFIPGWKSNQEGNVKRASEITKLGFICLTLDLRGHGQSDGNIDQFSRQDHLEDIKTAYNYLSSLKEVEKKIGIIGSSYGAYLAAVATNSLVFNWLVLRVPALYFDKNFDVPTDKLIKEDKKAFKTSGLTPKNSLALKGVLDFEGKLLIVESEKDEVIPHQVIENYLEICDKRKLTYKVMKNTRHSLESENQEKNYVNILKTWLQENI